jgi:hypothetical protein
MTDRLLFFFAVCFFCWACFFSATSVVFAMHAGEEHKAELLNNLQEALAEPLSVKSDNSQPEYESSGSCLILQREVLPALPEDY